MPGSCNGLLLDTKWPCSKWFWSCKNKYIAIVDVSEHERKYNVRPKKKSTENGQSRPFCIWPHPGFTKCLVQHYITIIKYTTRGIVYIGLIW
jgi:hypothetical protein